MGYGDVETKAKGAAARNTAKGQHNGNAATVERGRPTGSWSCLFVSNGLRRVQRLSGPRLLRETMLWLWLCLWL